MGTVSKNLPINTPHSVPLSSSHHHPHQKLIMMNYLHHILLLLSTLLAFAASHPTDKISNSLSLPPLNSTNISTSSNFHDGKWHLGVSSASDAARGVNWYTFCQTSNGSPRADYALAAVRELRAKTDFYTCASEHGKWCKKMWGYNHAALGLCAPGGFALHCAIAGGYYSDLIANCKKSVGSETKVGGYVRVVNDEVSGDINIYKV